MSALINSKFKSGVKQSDVNLANSAFTMVASLRTDGVLTPDAELSVVSMSNESFNTPLALKAASLMEGLQTTIESYIKQNPTFGTSNATPQQVQAVTYALTSAMNPRASIQRLGSKQAYATSGPTDVYLPDNSGLDPSKLGQKSLEAYDTKPNDETLQFTASYAMATATQNPFGELFYKTINLSPDQYAIEMEIPLISVHEQVRYELEKRLTDFHKLNIVNAEIDHTILKNDTLKIVPVWRDQTKDAFVDAADVAPFSTVLESGESIQTAPLRVNYRTSLMRVSNTDAQLAKGNPDQTDALDPGAVLEGVYVRFGGENGEVVRFDTKNSPMNQFVETRQGLTRRMSLDFTTDSAHIGARTRKHDGSALTQLAVFQGDAAMKVWFSFSIRGDISLEDTSYEILAGGMVVNTLKNAQDVVLDLDAPGQAAVKALLASAKIIGMDIDARKVNSNLRELGQLANFNTYRQTYGVSLGSPLAVQRPITNGDSQDALHAAALAYLCKVRQSNQAVTSLLAEVETVRQYEKRTNQLGRTPEVMGISAFLIDPVLEEMEIDLDKEVTTTAQHQRYQDVTTILTDSSTIMAYRMWQRSNWQAAANLLEGTEARYPEVGMGTDMVLGQYLITQGDMRTVGPDFSYKKAMSPDRRIYNKIFLCLNYPAANPGVPHPLDHGMMLQKPEVVAALNLSRGSHSRELIVHPSFRHIPLSPVLGVITVLNLDKALSKKATLQVAVSDFPSQPVTP